MPTNSTFIMIWSDTSKILAHLTHALLNLTIKYDFKKKGNIFVILNFC
jgi:hypothetical protein